MAKQSARPLPPVPADPNPGMQTPAVPAGPPLGPRPSIGHGHGHDGPAAGHGNSGGNK
jgi:hypothetical protein